MKTLDYLNNFVWGPATISLLIFTGIYFTVGTGFFQFRRFPYWFKNTALSIFKKPKDNNSISPFQALSTALAGTIGTGNIAGVATAISFGGPGALFWMVISAFFGMMTKYAEVVLAVKYRKVTKNGLFSGGPMYYIEKGLGLKLLGTIFAVLLLFSSFGIGNSVQANSVSTALNSSFGLSPKAVGFFLTIICFIIMIGGAKKIAAANEIIVPIMAAFFILGTILFLFLNIKQIPAAVSLIINDAFSVSSASSGVFGFLTSKSVKFGIARGVFTNEAGMGSAPVAHASANTNSAEKQGLWGIFEVFLDTVVMCTMTGLVILTADGGKLLSENISGIELTMAAYKTVFGEFGETFIALSIVFFAAATILGWGFYGEKAVEYLFGEKKSPILCYKILYSFAIYIGSVLSLEIVWSVSDILNGLMIFPNVITLLFLSKYVFIETKKEGS